MATPYTNWPALTGAPRSPFFHGTAADVAADRARHSPGVTAPLTPNDEALFTQSNARVLLGHAANGSLRFIALPTQVYPAPTGTGEFGLGPGMYHHFDVAMYAGNLSYRLELEGQAEPLVVSSWEAPLTGLPCETVYAGDFLPLTTAQAGDLVVALVSFAPVAPDAAPAALSPAPLPGPAGGFYVLHLHNTGDTPVAGKVVLQAGDLLVGHYEDAAMRAGADEALREVKAPEIDLRQHTIILTRPCGAVGIHLHDGRWRKITAPFEAEIAFSLAPGEARAFETHIALGATYADVMPTLYALHLRPALDWLNLTASFWRERLGALTAGIQGAEDEARYSRDVYVRSLLDNFNCLQTDAAGTLLAHWQGAPSHGYGTVWGIDVEPTAVSVVHICPELAWATLRFFMDRSRAPKGPADHSVPILVAPIVIARQWLQVTGDVDRLRASPDVVAALERIVADLLALKAPEETLFPSRFSSDGGVGRRYDYGTNVKVWYAFDSMAAIARCLGNSDAADAHAAVAIAIREAIARTMVGSGPLGRQITGGTNLGEDPGTFYLPEGVPYYDGEDTSSMLAPVYGLCGFTDLAWIAYHRWARSIWCPNFDPEFGAVRWSPRGFAAGALDGTAFFSRLGGSVTAAEMLAALRTLRDVGTDDVTGSVFWWPHGLEYRRSLTRCSQGQGAWAWQYLQQWLGIKVDAKPDTGTPTFTFAPRGLLTDVAWEGYRAGPHRFDIAWSERATVSAPPAQRLGESTAEARRETTDVAPRPPSARAETGQIRSQPRGSAAPAPWARITNHNAVPWRVRVGFRQPGIGALGSLVWHEATLAPGETGSFSQALPDAAVLPPTPAGNEDADLVRAEVDAFGSDGILIRRFGPALLWGHWELERLWEPNAMPLTLRLLVANGTGIPWAAVTVDLACPAGWRAQGRPPRHWPRPNALADRARVDLGAVLPATRAVAPFWLEAPHDLDLDLLWDERGAVPFHADTQPGPGLTLYARNIEDPIEVAVEVTVTITPEEGEAVARRLTVPVRVEPARS